MEMSYWSEMEHPVLDYVKAWIFPHLGAAQSFKAQEHPF